VLENFLGEGLFATKVVIEGTLGNSSKAKDFGYASGGVADFVDALKADLDQVFAGILHCQFSNRLVHYTISAIDWSITSWPTWVRADTTSA
jgi:hypothetical protein